ncbi:DUF551 domain-containing protein [Salmonella enterica]|nr:DUF551 domain-containing protein [Salmonella enterica]EDW4356351.1 DUF551 domain-containing protein [Salmonella enterica subsp. salamae]HCM1883128.1 DUF551 domain-containing protein [Salmonella enterica subsp. salamae serovar 60:z10:z39]EAX8455331.1 DUF551 domain-containing protein [Salmonella enterica]EAX8553303.1 DUF551 domain-containing protein [Salmonella enterica]
MTITKERLLKIQHWREIYGADSNVMLPAEEAAELARIALASLEVAPVGEVSEKRHGLVMDGTVDLGGKSTYRIIKGEKAMKRLPLGTKFYIAPPAPVVLTNEQREQLRQMDNEIVAELESEEIACRAAMLQGSQPVSNRDELQVIGWLRSDYNSDDKRDPNAPLFMLGHNDPSDTWGVKYIPLSGNSPVTPDGWISCSERMPNDKQYVWCWGKSYGWTEYDTFEGYYDWSRNKWWTVTDDGEEPASKVTHWMPLPEPPQEVK